MEINSSSPLIQEPIQLENVYVSNSLDHLDLTTMSIIAIIILLLALWKVKSNRKVKRSKIVVVGERFSGKTQLFIKINNGKAFDTVPSMVNNHVTKSINGNKFTLTDYIGDNLSKEEILSDLDLVHTIVHVIDGTDSKKLGDAALFLYRVMISKKFQKQSCNYIIFLNKSDEKTFFGLSKIEKRIEDEIETIKFSRKNQNQDNQFEEDYLKSQKYRFDLGKKGIKLVIGSAKEDIKGLELLLDDIC